MKPRGIISRSIIMRPSVLQIVSSVKKRKRLFLQNQYGTSSKHTSKFPFFNNLRNTTDSFMPVIWKSVSMMNSFLNNFTLKFSSKDKEVNDKESQTDTTAQKDENLNNNIKKRKSQDDSLNSVPAKQLSNQSDESSPTSSKNSKDSIKASDNIVPSDPNVELSFFEWLTGGNAKKEFLEKLEEKAEKLKKPVVTKSSLESRSRFLVTSISEAQSSKSQLLRLEELCNHLLQHPDQKCTMCKADLLRILLRLQYGTNDPAVRDQTKCALTLIGLPHPPQGDGIRILSIDGGGTRGILAIEILRQLEALTNKKVYQLFDYFCGVSSGAILGYLLGGLRMSLDECESLYRTLSDEIFNQSSFWGTGNLMWNHAYYDTNMWVKSLQRSFGETLLIDTVKRADSPKLAAVSTIMNLPCLQPFVFRNYDFPPGLHSYYKGSCKYKMWEAIRASGAAPGYFEEYCLDDLLHQDGGVMMNNPTALAIHEARLLWPSDKILCVMSLGTGRYLPATNTYLKSTNLKTKIMKIIDSATDTESVHIVLNDLLSPNTYFRMNPYLTEFHTLDENRPEKLDQMKSDAQMYLRRNEYKFMHIAEILLRPRSSYKTFKDWLHIRKNLYL